MVGKAGMAVSPPVYCCAWDGSLKGTRSGGRGNRCEVGLRVTGRRSARWSPVVIVSL